MVRSQATSRGDKAGCCERAKSLAIGHQYSSLGTQPILCGSIPGLVPKQLRFCRNYVQIMPSVAEGVKIGIQECQHQFRGRRWNCTTVNDSLAIFGPVLDKGCPQGEKKHIFAQKERAGFQQCQPSSPTPSCSKPDKVEHPNISPIGLRDDLEQLLMTSRMADQGKTEVNLMKKSDFDSLAIVV
ncbi:hypothetical protein E2320_001479 [Naja naja]|nr:hypothetical protein E2320_001479 [Naja naja]